MSERLISADGHIDLPCLPVRLFTPRHGAACREEMGHSAADSRIAGRDDPSGLLFLLQETRERDAVQGDKETEYQQVIGRVDLPDKPCQNKKDRSHVLSSLGLVGLMV